MFSLTLSYKIHENINAASMFMMLGVVYDAINRCGQFNLPPASLHHWLLTRQSLPYQLNTATTPAHKIPGGSM